MMRWDIFCHVIDNYGDIGVCWRLSRQLAAEHGISVRLWVDDLASLQPLCPAVDTRLAVQHCQGVELRKWVEPWPDVEPAEVVIEAFGCELPQRYVEAMAAPLPCQPEQSPEEKATKRVWINLEYLSAESWVEGCHGLASPHPRLPLTKYFFFPGFSAATGGLLREAGLLAQRAARQRQPATGWRQLGLPEPETGQTAVSLFCYDHAPISALLAAWAAASMPVRCLLPMGKALAQAAGWAGKTALKAGDRVMRGNLTLQVIPFLTQADYDHLLWLCDCNFVRGEDSFVRAQWAARPLLWQIYPQADNAHQVKLEAFLARYCQGLSNDDAAAVRRFHGCWNGGGRLLDWDGFWRRRARLQAHAQAWATQLAQAADLASNLVDFCMNQQTPGQSNDSTIQGAGTLGQTAYD